MSVHRGDGLLPGVWSRGVPAPGGACSRGGAWWRPPRTATAASYWNAFLFKNYVSIINCFFLASGRSFKETNKLDSEVLQALQEEVKNRLLINQYIKAIPEIKKVDILLILKEILDLFIVIKTYQMNILHD